MGQAFRAAAAQREGKWRTHLVQMAAQLRPCAAKLGRKLKKTTAAAAEALAARAVQLGWLAAAVLGGAAVLPGQVAPFGLAVCIAAPQPSAFVCCVLCALGGFWGLPAVLAVGQAAGALLTGALRLVLGRKNDIWAGLAGNAVCGMLSQTVSLLGQPQAGPLRWVVQGCLVLALALLYRELDGGWLAMTPRRQLVRLAVWTSLFCVLACVPLPVGEPLLYAVGLGLAGLVLCSLERPERLPSLWAGAALACLCARVSPVYLAAGMFSAWLAGRFAVRRGVAAAVYAACGLTALFYADSLAVFGRLLLAQGAAALLFLFVPQRLLYAAEDALLTADAGAAGTPSRTLQALAGGLEAIGNGMEAVGRACAGAPEDPNAPVETVCRQVCSACTQKARCWGAEYDGTQQAMQAFLEKWRQDCTAEFPTWFACSRQSTVRTALLRAENLRVLRRAGQAENGVLRRAVSDQYRAVAEGLARMAAAWQPETPQPQLESRIHALANAMQLPVRELCAVRRGDAPPEIRLLLRPVRLSKEVMDTLEYSVSRCCGRPMTGVLRTAAEGQELSFQARPRCVLRVGAARRAHAGACGDVTEQMENGTLQYFLLCDGMGTGENAAMDAKMTALFTARLLRAGFECDVAARLVNAALLTRAPGDRGSTLDVLRFNGMDGAAALYKAGACASYLVRGGGIRRLGGEAGTAANGLPLGGAGTVRDARLELALQPGDRIVMVSDGVLAGGEKTLLAALKTLPAAEPSAMAQAVLAACAAARPEDDCTVALLCVEQAAEPFAENRQ